MVGSLRAPAEPVERLPRRRPAWRRIPRRVLEAAVGPPRVLAPPCPAGRHPAAFRRRTEDVDREQALFTDLDRTGTFHRDSAVGRIFHPGTASFRQMTPNDSLHIAVSPDNRVSVHVDRLSPLAIRAGAGCRYSLVRAVAHTVVHAAESLARICQGRGGRHRCELECEGRSRDAGEGRIYQFSCRAAGAGGCGWVARATSEQELLAKVAEHARTVHGVKALNSTIEAYALHVAGAVGVRP